MVYGKGCNGNYQLLRRIALKFSLFPRINNERSVVYIGNLCKFVRICIDSEVNGLFFPQNNEYVCTSKMVELISRSHKKKMRFPNFFNIVFKLAKFDIVKKVFGNLIYEKVDLLIKFSFEESVKVTEK
jgi:UDP-glucose 4-epimerase